MKAAAPIAASPLSEPQAQFIQSGVSVIAASCNAQGVPSQARGVGCEVSADRRQVTVYLRRPQCAALLEDIARSGAIAVVFCQPSTHRTLQLKAGDAAEVAAEARPALMERQIGGFCRELAPLGYSEAWTRTFLGYTPSDLIAIRFTPEAVFSQTPGPRAGERVA